MTCRPSGRHNMVPHGRPAGGLDLQSPERGLVVDPKIAKSAFRAGCSCPSPRSPRGYVCAPEPCRSQDRGLRPAHGRGSSASHPRAARSHCRPSARWRCCRMNHPRHGRGPDATNVRATATTQTSTRQDAPSDRNGTAVPLAVTIIGADALHRLAAAGYRVAGVCRCCGAPLVNVTSVARGLGPVCSNRVMR